MKLEAKIIIGLLAAIALALIVVAVRHGGQAAPVENAVSKSDLLAAYEVAKRAVDEADANIVKAEADLKEFVDLTITSDDPKLSETRQQMMLNVARAKTLRNQLKEQLNELGRKLSVPGN